MLTIGEARPDEPGALRELHFPADHALGWLDLRESPPHDDPWRGDQWRDTLRLDLAWQRAGPARGMIGIPAAMQARLRINASTAADLSPLSALGPTDLQALVL